MASTQKLPRYCVVASGRHKSITYQRRYPTDVAPIIGRSHYKIPLNLKPPPECTEAELARAVEAATQQFELAVKMIRNSDPSAYSESEIEMAAAALLRARRLRPGQFAEHEDAWDAALNVTDAASDDELYGVGTPLEGKVKPTIDDLARQRAAQALIDVKKKPKTKLLSALFDDYQRFNPESGKALQDRTRYWNTAISYIGETYASSDSADRIREGLNTWVSDRLDNITAASAQRELGSVMAILNWADEALGLGWVIRPIPPAKLKPHKARTKTPLNKEQQVEFLRWLHEKNDGKSAVLAIMLNGGVSATEIAGLDVEDTRLGLAAEHPHVVVTKGKTKNRVRIVPITVAVELIQAQGIDGIEWAKSIHPSSVSATLNKRLHKAGFEETTTHALRHTLAGNAKINRVSNVELELIAGWRNQSDVSDFVMHYGAEERSEYITPLTAASRDIHQHLLTAHGNVVPMKRKAVSP